MPFSDFIGFVRCLIDILADCSDVKREFMLMRQSVQHLMYGKRKRCIRCCFIVEDILSVRNHCASSKEEREECFTEKVLPEGGWGLCLRQL